MHWLKGILYRTLRREQYLRLVSRLFFVAYWSGALRLMDGFDCHYYVRRLIQPGDYVIDIGANLGYYTVIFAEKVGPEGKIFSVEPAPLYQTILRDNTASYEQVEHIPYALGSESGTVQMGIPGAAPHRHGLTQVLGGGPAATSDHTFEAELRHPEALFREVQRIDYVKCDIEGFESEVLPAMEGLLRTHRPTVQAEVAVENRDQIWALFKRLGYTAFFVDDGELVQLEGPQDPQAHGDWIFRTEP